jgi:Lon protease-like protein
VSTRLPLFPLGTVLVPGEVLNLHIFEPRYRALVDDLLSKDPRVSTPVFGVVAIRAGLEVGREQLRALHGVGCVAEVLEITGHPDGSSDVMAVGRQRFRLLDLDPEAGTPYLTGVVEWLEEPVVAVPPELVTGVQDAFDVYCSQLGSLVTGSVDARMVPDEPYDGRGLAPRRPDDVVVHGDRVDDAAPHRAPGAVGCARCGQSAARRAEAASP